MNGIYRYTSILVAMLCHQNAHNSILWWIDKRTTSIVWTTLLTVVLWGPSLSPFYWCFMDCKRPMNAQAFPMNEQRKRSGYEQSTGVALGNAPPSIAQVPIGRYPQVCRYRNRYHHRLWFHLPFPIPMDFRYLAQRVQVYKMCWERHHSFRLPIFGNCSLLLHPKATWVIHCIRLW